MAVASSSNLSPAPATSPESSSLLAPGFRFHPTDEELIIYYLKRKVSNRPLRVDAIAEVDLYKAEPWDLPSLSRLRSRDMEWYFFSPLDRKYANRSRTNRATSQGYWKTTGKDRPIRRGPRVVGMKKTLVFHVGRAPRGERTNWVMHEYRLEDEELASAGIPQDSYVVCRIFQKSGSGPQNGAQYGAPFNEEEWEEEGNTMTLNVVDGGEADTDNLALTPIDGRDSGVVGNAEYFQLSDFVEYNSFQNQGQDNQDEIRGSFLTPDSDLQNSGSAPEEDPIFLLEGIFQDPGYIDVMDPPEQQEHQSSQNDEFLELNDILDPVEIFASMNDTANSASMFQMHPFQDGFYLDTNGLNQAVEENPVFYDASSNDLPLGIENFLEIDGMYSPTAGSGGFTEVDDIASYFNSDVLDDSSENFYVDSSGSNESNFSPEVGSTVPTPVQASNFVGASSSVNLPGAGNWSNSINENVNVGPDSHGPEGWDKTLTKRVVNMLGAISAPPALAAEFPISPSKSSGQASTTNSASSSIHVTAGMIQIHGFRVNGDAGFLLSYGVASRKLDGLEPVTKIRGWSLSVVLRGGFCLFFLSAMVLALCLKVGIRVYSK